MSHTIERLYITVEGVMHALAPHETVGDLREQITQAVRDGGGFVDLSIAGGKLLSVFFSSTTPVTISVKTTQVSSDTVDYGGPNAPVGDVDPDAGDYTDLI